LSDFLNIGEIFVVEDVGTLNIAKTNVVVVAVTCVDKNGEQLLIGSSMYLGDIKEAVVKATLDAVNRRIAKLTGK
jgi:DNA polymerase III alpha subunit (gram-positive type)